MRLQLYAPPKAHEPHPFLPKRRNALYAAKRSSTHPPLRSMLERTWRAQVICRHGHLDHAPQAEVGGGVGREAAPHQARKGEGIVVAIAAAAAAGGGAEEGQ